MKKIIIAVCVLGFMGCGDTHFKNPLIVSGVEVSTNLSHPGKYVVKIEQQQNGCGTLLIFTDKLYQVGDTLVK